MNEILTTREVVKSFGKLQALRGVSLAVGKGELHGLIGPNGSGKSTLLKCIVGAETTSGGTITFDGMDVTRVPPDQRARLGMCLKFQVTSILPALSVYDNVLLAVQRNGSLGQLLRSSTRRALRPEVTTLLEAVNLADRASVLAQELSHGQQQWLEIAMAISQRPSLLLLDEPTAGMNREERRATGDLLERLARGTSMVIVEHDLDFVRRMCTRITVLEQGEVIAEGSASEIEQNENVKGAFIGRR
ncbi:MAG TPA: ABC transporter ATP-binding protein [Gammaproteobacteria bacterium]|nr:ABC transporter ATP-binding protein [Gammaproteobacteria bacterium]